MSSARGVDHVQLPIRPGGSPSARVFYESLIGLKEWRHPQLDRPGTLRFAMGAQRLDLTEGHYSGVAPQAHLAIHVHALADIRARLQRAGVLVDDAPLNDPPCLYVEDPFGNRLELIDAQASAAHTAASHGPAAPLGALRFAI
jgi:catechol 2,3-dioxygenase-like lactoylglutathione lyase family enzyme